MLTSTSTSQLHSMQLLYFKWFNGRKAQIFQVFFINVSISILICFEIETLNNMYINVDNVFCHNHYDLISV